MKRIIAYIKPGKLLDVTFALHHIEGLTGITTMDVKGFGRGRTKGKIDNTVQDKIGFLNQTRIEIVCSDKLTATIVASIQENAHTGLRGDGKIYISDVNDAIRISTGETGDIAV